MTGQGWKCLRDCSEDWPGSPIWCLEGQGREEEGRICEPQIHSLGKDRARALLFKAYPHTVLSLRPTFGILQSLSRKEVSSSTEGLEGYPYFLQHPAKGCLHSLCISSNSWISNTEERQQEGKQRLARESSAGCWNRAFQLMLGGPGPFSGLVSEDALLA